MEAATVATAPQAGFARAALRGAVALWWAVTLLGQWAFFYYIAALYGVSTLSGNPAGWSRNTLLFKGYVPGDRAGNAAFAAHALLAGYMAFGGALQLLPLLRRRAPRFHRWNGRLFAVMALGVSLSGFYMVWVRHSNPTLEGSLATTLNGVLIAGCAAMAWRTALMRDFARHRRWALRLFVVASGQWFIRVGFFAFAIAVRGAGLGVPMAPFLHVWNFGCYLVPLLLLEIYLRVKDGGGAGARLAFAGGLTVLTLLMAAGIAGGSLFLWKAVLVKL